MVYGMRTDYHGRLYGIATTQQRPHDSGAASLVHGVPGPLFVCTICSSLTVPLC
jgi:hypothetical protein